MGRLNEALSDYDQAIRLGPGLLTAYGGRGLVHRAKGELDAALADCDYILRINPKDVQAHTGRGLVYEERGEFQLARTDYKVASESPLRNVIDKERLYLDADSTRYRNTARVRLKVLAGVEIALAMVAIPASVRSVIRPTMRVR
jgi:tetratricopeptide (TPR) repeat protein